MTLQGVLVVAVQGVPVGLNVMTIFQRHAFSVENYRAEIDDNDADFCWQSAVQIEPQWLETQSCRY